MNKDVTMLRRRSWPRDRICRTEYYCNKLQFVLLNILPQHIQDSIEFQWKRLNTFNSRYLIHILYPFSCHFSTFSHAVVVGCCVITTLSEAVTWKYDFSYWIRQDCIWQYAIIKVCCRLHLNKIFNFHTSKIIRMSLLLNCKI